MNKGDGVTVLRYTDRQVYTVIGKTDKTLTLQRDIATKLDNPEFIPGGFSGVCTNNKDITYEYKKDEKGEIIKAYWSAKKGAYYVGQCAKVVSGRKEFYDYNF